MRVLSIASVLLVVSLTGCGGSGAAADKYDQVAVGMTPAQVEAILGPASSTVEEISGELKLWLMADGTQVAISFEDGKVKSKDRAKR